MGHLLKALFLLFQVVERQSSHGPDDVAGLADVTGPPLRQTLEVQAQQLVLRLSYNDVKLLARIIDSLPRQVTLP